MLSKIALIRKNLSIIVLSIWITLFSSSAKAEESATAEFIATGMKYYRSLIKDIKANYKFEVDFSQVLDKTAVQSSKGFTEECTWALKGEKEFSHVKTTYEDGTVWEGIGAYDGEVNTSWMFSPNPNNPDDPGTGRIMPSNELRYNYSPESLAFTIAFNPYYWDEVLLNGTAQVLGKEEVNGHECYIVEGNYWPNPASSKYRVWVDINRSFLPLKYETFSENGRPSIFCDSIELKKFPGDIWFPIKGKFFVKEGQLTAGAQHVLTVDENSVEINMGIPDDFFRLKWKKGVMIWDDRIDKGMTIGEEELPSSPEEIKKLVQREKEEEARRQQEALSQLEKQQELPTRIKQNNRIKILTASIIILILAGLGFTIIRRNKRKTG